MVSVSGGGGKKRIVSEWSCGGDLELSVCVSDEFGRASNVYVCSAQMVLVQTTAVDCSPSSAGHPLMVW